MARESSGRPYARRLPRLRRPARSRRIPRRRPPTRQPMCPPAPPPARLPAAFSHAAGKPPDARASSHAFALASARAAAGPPPSAPPPAHKTSHVSARKAASRAPPLNSRHLRLLGAQPPFAPAPGHAATGLHVIPCVRPGSVEELSVRETAHTRAGPGAKPGSPGLPGAARRRSPPLSRPPEGGARANR